MGMSREALHVGVVPDQVAAVAKSQASEVMSSFEETASRINVDALIEGCRKDGRLDFQKLTDLLNDKAIVVHQQPIDKNTRRMLIKELRHLLQSQSRNKGDDSVSHLRIDLGTRNALFRARIYSISEARALLSNNETVSYIGEKRTDQLRSAIARFDDETAAATVDDPSGSATFSDLGAGI